MRWRSSVVIVLASVGVSALARGQSPACEVPRSEQSMPGLIRATLRPREGNRPSRAYTALVLEAIGQQYRSDAPIALPVYAIGKDSVAEAAGVGVVELTATRDGSIENVHLVATSLSPAFDRSILDAVRAAGKAGLPLMPGPGAGGARLVLEVRATGNPDPGHGRDSVGAASMVWARTTIPIWPHAIPIGLAPGPSPVPIPESVQWVREERSIVMQYVVDRNGHVVPGTEVAAHVDDRLFLRAIAKGIPKIRFLPTTIGGCAVPTLVVMPFTLNH